MSMRGEQMGVGYIPDRRCCCCRRRRSSRLMKRGRQRGPCARRPGATSGGERGGAGSRLRCLREARGGGALPRGRKVAVALGPTPAAEAGCGGEEEEAEA